MQPPKGFIYVEVSKVHGMPKDMPGVIAISIEECSISEEKYYKPWQKVFYVDWD